MKAETFEFGTGQWSTGDDYPFAPTDAGGLYDYDMVYIEKESAFFVIGGEFITTNYNWDELATIAKYQSGAWSDAGQLTQPRYVSF